MTANDDFGQRLRGARERRGVSLPQLAGTTKIPLSALEALERNDYAHLPGGIFTRGFVRAYAGAVGLDPDETVREYTASLDERRPDPGPGREPPLAVDGPVSAPARWVPAVAVTIAIVLVVASYLLVRTGGTSTPRSEAAATTGAAAPQVLPESVGTSGQEPRAARAADGSFDLQLQAAEPCWVTLTVDGRRVVHRVVRPGEVERHRVNGSAVLRVGNAGVLTYSLDGAAGQPLGPRGAVKTVRFDRETLAHYLR